MSHVNEEMINANNQIPDCPSMNMVDIMSKEIIMPRKYQKRKILKVKTYSLRKKDPFQNINHLSVKNITLEALHKLLCKPVSVSLIRLTDSDLKQFCKKPLEIKKVEKSLKQKQFLKFHARGRKKKEKCNKGDNEMHKEIYENKVNKNIVASSVQRSSNYTEIKGNLLRNIKQPTITLNRIDVVINKLAQSFAKVIPNKQCNIVVQAPIKQHIAVTQTEKIGITSQKSLINSNTDDYSQISNVNSSISDTNENENLQDEQKIDHNDINCDSDDAYEIKWKFKRKAKINYDSSDEINFDEFYTKISKQTKRVKLSSLQKGTVTTNEEYYTLNEKKKNVENQKINFANEKVIAEDEEMDFVAQEAYVGENKLNFKDVLGANDDEEEIDVESIEINGKQKQDVNNKIVNVFQELTKCIEENCASNSVSKACLKVKDISCTSENEVVSDGIEVQQQVFKSCISDNELIQKYKLCKGARVLLINLQHIKSSFDYKYSAVEIEQLTQKYINLYLHSNLSSRDYNIAKSSFAKRTTKFSEFSNVVENSLTNVSSSLVFVEPLEKIDMMQSKSLTSITDSLDTIENSLTLEKKNSSWKEQLSNTRVHDHKTDAKQLTTISASFISPIKHKKIVERREITKDKDFSNNYKCIVCDLYFEDYSVLKQHLSRHTKETTQISLSPSKSTTSIKNVTLLKGLQVRVVVPSISNNTEPQQSCNGKSISQAVSPSTSVTDKQGLLQKNQQKRLAYTKHKKQKLSSALKETNECGVCFHEFPSRTDLAAHIFLHTESELQEAFEIAKKNVKKVVGNAKKNKNDADESSKTASESEKSCSKAITVQKQDKESSKNINENIMCSSKTSTNHKQDKQSTMHSKSKSFEQANGIHNPETNKSVFLERHSSKSNQTSSVIKNKAVQNKKLFTICQCHNKADASFNCLKIEIVLLCHTCKVLYRSKECFESHYRLSHYSACDQNRFNNGRSPNLFCATCGMLFSSVQDVRQHLELHVRFNQNCTMDFRCNICKVMFIGIGPLFYIHWSKHTRDPFWKANERSFPEVSIINPKLRKDKETCKPGEFTLNKCIDSYIYVGEHICPNCKSIFINDYHLKTHKKICKEVNSVECQNVQPVVEENQFTLRLICSLCNNIFSDELELFMHMKNRHNFATDPQFVCVSLTDVERTFICSICMEVTENIEQFNKHWLKHYVSLPWFVCINCGEKCNSLNLFLEHVKEHNKRSKKISCKVIYRQVKFVCKLCHIGFEDQKWLREHNVIHNLNKGTQDEDINEVTNQGNSTLNLEVNNVCNTLKETESTIENIFKNCIKIEHNQDNDVIKEKVECSKYKTNLDKEKLINILEGNEEEDSENELVIDLTERSELHNESVMKDRFKEKQIVTENLLLKSCSLPRLTSEEITTSSSGAVHLDNTETSSLQNNLHSQKIQDSHIPTSDSQSILTANKEPSDKNDFIKQKHGFLRVKSLAELTGKKNSLHDCKVCQDSFKSAEDLKQHVMIHIAEKHSKESLSKKKPISQQPSSSIGQHKVVICKPLKPLIKIGKAIPIQKSLFSSATNAEVSVTKPHISVSPLQSSVSAYHKNLPACSIVRKLSTPRTITQISTKDPTSMAIMSSNTQNVQITSTTINSNKGIHPNIYAALSLFPKTLNSNSLGGNKNAHKGVTYYKYRPQLSATNYSNMDNTTTTSNVNCSSSNQNLKQNAIQNQVKVTPSTTIYYQYPILDANYSENAQRPIQSQQIRPKQPITENVSSAFYYKNITNSGMSILINSTVPPLPSLAPLSTHPQQRSQPQIYHPVVSVDPYTQQSKNTVDYSGPDELYQVDTNDYDTPVGGNITTCEATLQPSADLVCPYCPNSVSFTNRDLFELHINISHNFTCEICSISFYSIEELTIHRMKHELT